VPGARDAEQPRHRRDGEAAPLPGHERVPVAYC
jgi:hypothetical protein